MASRPAPTGRRRWSSNLMFIAAAVGSAVGISNVWKFTYVAGENGGGAFVLIYVAAIAFIALPALIAEFLLGRRGRGSVVGVMDNLAEREGIHRAWRHYGQMAALGAFLALSFYAVVAGWMIDYLVVSLTSGFAGITAAEAGGMLDGLFASPGRMILSQLAFLAATAIVVGAGIRHGLERVLRWMTPALFVILLVLLAYSLLNGDVRAGLRFLFLPDFSKLDGVTVLMAVGQAFFSLGIGLGVLMTIGAYMDSDASIVRSAVVVAIADGGVALLAGLAIFPVVFAYALSPAEGPGLIFSTLPIAFGQMPGGAILGPLFFLLMTFAALTSAITILECVVATVEDYSRLSRRRIVVIVSGLLWLVGLGTVFSFNLWSEVYPLGFIPALEDRTVFATLDYVVSNFMMPAGGVLVAVLAGWGLSRRASLEELGVGDTPFYRVWRPLVRYAVPVAILLVFVTSL